MKNIFKKNQNEYKEPKMKIRLTQQDGNVEIRRFLNISEHVGYFGSGIDHIQLMKYKDGKEDWCEITLKDLEEIYDRKKSIKTT